MRALVATCGLEHCDFKGKQQPSYADALIAPNGTFYNVGNGGHVHAAYDHGMTTDTQLEEEGWIHFSSSYRGNPIVNDPMPVLTQDQIDTLFDIVVAMGRGDVAHYAIPEFMDRHAAVLSRIIKEGRNE